jgi:hypothetical protein
MKEYKRIKGKKGNGNTKVVNSVCLFREGGIFVSLPNSWIYIDVKKKEFEEGDYEG